MEKNEIYEQYSRLLPRGVDRFNDFSMKILNYGVTTNPAPQAVSDDILRASQKSGISFARAHPLLTLKDFYNMEPLQVDVVHFYPRENAQPHNTIKFEVINEENPTTTIVRRGQPFNGVVRFTRPFDENEDIVQLMFTLGDKPQMDTQGAMFIHRDAVTDKHTWTAKLLDVQSDTVSFEEIASNKCGLMKRLADRQKF
ncbi:Hemocyte protein-glutamine gamma-glutamyltransferase [Papilio xuthus]|uniref:Hemocyte protein-glutamine gamma-glutamyltransferase n=1 Tax=Papilio xuthus TaxID=66420 RepID=A0A0N1IAM5_PAPXU|nr:Hemocyte protein-glutamine gamma-glutamyltransferase [Papilio xuthus]